MTLLTKREFQAFDAAGQSFVYLVPSAAVFHLDETARAVLDVLGDGVMTREQMMQHLTPRFAEPVVVESINELLAVRAIGDSLEAPDELPNDLPEADFPLTTMVLNVTNKCNLSCTYCYEYGEDQIVDPATGMKPRFMDESTARDSVDFMLRSLGDQRIGHITFFGGETLLNFKVLQSTLTYARERAATAGKEVTFSMTTNATLLRDEVIDWLVKHDVAVTVSIDGGREQQDAHRVFKNGMGSYDVIMPKVKELLRRHRRRPVGARVTLTRDNLDVVSIYRELTEELGFGNVGFAPVTTSWLRQYAIEDDGFEFMLSQFQELARDYLNASLQNRHHGFSNIQDTLEEIHKGVSKAYPCGAGLGLMGVATDGDVGLCHRFAGSDEHKLGTVTEGVDRERQVGFLEMHHIANKTDCSMCWARPLCAGGCYHEAHTRYGSSARANLHYCEWIRRWTQTCLEVYGELAVRNPGFLQQFDRN